MFDALGHKPPNQIIHNKKASFCITLCNNWAKTYWKQIEQIEIRHLY